MKRCPLPVTHEQWTLVDMDVREMQIEGEGASTKAGMMMVYSVSP